MKTSKLMITGLMLLTFLLAASVSYAQGHGPGQRGKGFDQGMDRGFDRKAEQLNLTGQQQGLLDAMKDTRENHVNVQRTLKKDIREAFHEQMAKEKPDFAGAVAKLKAQYIEADAKSHEEMIDSKVRFFQSLTAEQRQEWTNLGGDRMGKGQWRGMDRGRGDGYGYGRGNRR